jgi:hypothetical protein
MDITGCATDSFDLIRSDGYSGFLESMRPVKHKVLSAGNIMYPRGTSIYDKEWDLLIILDACRYDLFLEVADDYEWIEEVGEIRSLDSTTAHWMRRTFVKDHHAEMANTAYICGNPFSQSELDSRDFAELIELWRSAWTEPGTVPPEAVTDETIRAMKAGSYDRVIAHYMQPHCPFISRPELSQGKVIDDFGNQDWRDVWELLRDEDIDLDDLWSGYRENLKIGLEEVTSLIKNVDAENVVVTSDHGNATGQWGVYGHPPNLPIRELRRVPWVETQAKSIEAREPDDWNNQEIAMNREEQLSSLGYI